MYLLVHLYNKTYTFEIVGWSATLQMVPVWTRFKLKYCSVKTCALLFHNLVTFSALIVCARADV